MDVLEVDEDGNLQESFPSVSVLTISLEDRSVGVRVSPYLDHDLAEIPDIDDSSGYQPE